MHEWAKAFPRAAEALTKTQMQNLHRPAPERPLHLRNSTTVMSSDREGMMEIFNVKPSASGAFVSPETAMRLTSVYRCAALIAGAIAMLPCPIYRTEDDGSRASQRDHALWTLLNEQPTPRFSAATFWEFITASMLLRGDGIAIIRWNKAGLPVELIPVPRESVVITRKGDRLMYAVANLNGDGEAKGFDQDDVLHFPGFGFNGVSSMSIVRWAAFNAIGTSLAMEEFAGKFFVDGATQKVALTTSADLDEEDLTKLRNLWTDTYAGSSNAHKPMILFGGMDAKTISLSAEDAQLLESRRFQVEDIARAFGVPPFMIGAVDKTSAWGSGVEHMGQGFLTFTLQPHLNRFQQEINRKMFLISRYFVEFNTDGLMQADSQATAKYFREAIGGSQGPGWMVIDEVRRLKNLPPIEGGDKLYQPKGTDNAPKKSTEESA